MSDTTDTRPADFAETALAPCPFCRSEVVGLDRGAGGSFVGCNACWASGSEVPYGPGDDWRRADGEAVLAWNRIAAEVERLRAIAEAARDGVLLDALRSSSSTFRFGAGHVQSRPIAEVLGLRADAIDRLLAALGEGGEKP
jgi:hypothetical protein